MRSPAPTSNPDRPALVLTLTPTPCLCPPLPVRTAEFNSLIVFRVPRPHEVSPVTASAPQHRFSIFGWWMTDECLDDVCPLRGRGARGTTLRPQPVAAGGGEGEAAAPQKLRRSHRIADQQYD